MRFHFDTNAFSDYMRRYPSFDRHLAQLAPADSLAMSVIARGEILYGLGKLPIGQRRELLTARASELLNVVGCDPMLPAAGDEYAKIKLVRERNGLRLEENDLWIAASAIAHGATLVSRDTDLQS